MAHRVEEYPGKNADKLVNRRLAQVYTPGTVLDGPMLVGHALAVSHSMQFLEGFCCDLSFKALLERSDAKRRGNYAIPCF